MTPWSVCLPCMTTLPVATVCMNATVHPAWVHDACSGVHGCMQQCAWVHGAYRCMGA